MNWRTVFIQTDQNIKIKNNSLIIRGMENEENIPIYLDDIGIIIIDNYKTNITIQTLIELTNRNIPLMINNLSHDPVGLLLALHGHHKPLQNFNLQLELNQREKDKFQQQIIKQKIENQKILMQYLGSSKINIEKMDNYHNDVIQGDKRNRESSAARLYFISLFGSGFIRFQDNAINKSMNYGYKVLASKISSAIVKAGLHPSLGFFHKTANNYFNLTYDLIEPYRPLLDFIIVENNEILLNEKDETISLIMRAKLVSVLDQNVIINNQITKVRHAIDITIKSIISYFKNNEKELMLPKISFNKNEDF
ncbi:MAG: CRISPR-associated endonuclease Cas1 [Candidatus Hepatoplasma vulgare]|nr:MAG: CRISPR-associated endonuclease Cas1 [Candidatus Hepatoplasma sp.]